MSNSWFRMYTEVAEDPKVQRLPAPLFRVWVNLLCIAAGHDGVLPSMADVAYRLRVNEKKAAALVEELVKAGLFDRTEGGIVAHNWRGRQYDANGAAARMRRYRVRKRNEDDAPERNASVTRDVTENVTRDVTSDVTPLRYSDTEQNRTEVAEVKNTSASDKRRDLSYDLFEQAHQQILDAVYQPKTADFVQLAALRRAYNIGTRASPPHWVEAINNYFASNLPAFTLADLCTRYAVFRNGPVDRYNRHGGGDERKSKVERTLENAQRLRDRLDRQDRERSERGVERGDDGGVHGTAAAAPGFAFAARHEPHD